MCWLTISEMGRSAGHQGHPTFQGLLGLESWHLPSCFSWLYSGPIESRILTLCVESLLFILDLFEETMRAVYRGECPN